MDKKKFISNIMLVIAAAIWGFSFVAQRSAMEYIGPFTFNAFRYLLGALSLLPLIYYNDRKQMITACGSSADINASEIVTDEVDRLNKKELKKVMILGSLICGLFNWAGSVLVQVGLVYTAASKAAFITSLYIVIVPIFGIFLKKKTTLLVWIGVVISVAGLYFLCVSEDISIAFGDIILFCSTFFFAAHILLIARVALRVDGIRFVRNEAFFSALWSFIIAVIVEKPELQGILSCTIPLIFSGILAVGAAYALQVTAQKYTDPSVAALLMSLEALFGAIGGVLILHETFTLREFIGGFLLMAAIITAQLSPELLRKKPVR